MMISRRLFALCLLATASPALAADSPPCSEGAVRSELFFGLSRPGGTVSDEAVAAFLDEEVTPRFPDGMTLVAAQGRWRSGDGKVVMEGAQMAILLHPPEERALGRIEEIRLACRTKF